MAPRFEYAQAEEIRDTFARHGVRYLFIGKSGAILLGYPDTTQDADLFLEKAPANGAAVVIALRELGLRGNAGSRSRGFLSATRTTSSEARKPPIGRRTARRCLVSGPSASTGSGRDVSGSGWIPITESRAGSRPSRPSRARPCRSP